jgi:voltage-gated potassium channel
MNEEKQLAPWQDKLHNIIFESDTPAGKLFDVILLWAILSSVLMVILESIPEINAKYHFHLKFGEWFFTICFTIEYILRIISVARPRKYIFSFLGIVDLLSIIPTYLSLIFVGTQYLAVVRAIRLLRVFRILKLTRYLGEAQILSLALKGSFPKIVVFVGGVFSLVLIAGAVLYLIEGPKHGFDNIPISMYWAVVTLTTVGYGDLIPGTNLGKAVSAFIMILGYGIIAVPTGIMSVEISKAHTQSLNNRACRSCGANGHDLDAKFCKFCGGSTVRNIN